MRVVIQRVSEASVTVDGEKVAQIDKIGMLILLGITPSDSEEDVKWLVKKIIGLRIFSDENGNMNLNLNQIEGEVMIISQFTLYASTKKGNRPSFIAAAKPEMAIPLYEKFCAEMRKYNLTVTTGIFGADMKVRLLNDGPVTINIDSQKRE